jgi:ubiquinone/menaquinone biosynthesis C-methylase UbiE
LKNVSDLYIKKDTLSTRINLHDKYSVNKYGWGNWVFDQYNIKEKYKILEFGCGTGNIWREKESVLPDNIEITLTDISPLMIEKAKEKLCSNEKFNFKIMDIQNVPFSDNCFDIIIANHMLYHVLDIEKASSEIKRLLTNDGVFYTTTVGKNHLIQLEIIYRIFNNFAKFSYSSELSFILENGIEILSKYFSKMDIKRYNDSLEVTDINDLMDYIISYNNMPQKIYQEIYKIIEKEINLHGKMKIIKDSGMFICKK